MNIINELACQSKRYRYVVDAINKAYAKLRFCLHTGNLAIVFVIPLSLSVIACGDLRHQDSAPNRTVSTDRIANAIPKNEEKSKQGNPSRYKVRGKTYKVLNSSTGYRARGKASWYGTQFHGKSTANGEKYDMYSMTAAHKTLPLPSYVKVTLLETGSSIIVRVNDRGPFHQDRIIDLSYVAARKLGLEENGTGIVEVVALEANGEEPKIIPSGEKFLQIGVFKDRANAERLYLQLSKSGFGKVQVNPQSDNQGILYRVRVGPIIESDDIDQLRQKLHRQGFEEVFLVHD